MVNISGMKKAQRQLTQQGYRDAGAYLKDDDDGKPSLGEHLWMPEYNTPMLDFFDSVLPSVSISQPSARPIHGN